MARWLRKSSAEQATARAALMMPEPRPLSDAAKATMQTNSGAGLATAMELRSRRMAISAVAAVKPGPETARQSTRMRSDSSTGNKGRSLTDSCTRGGVFRFVLKMRLTRSPRLLLFPCIK